MKGYIIRVSTDSYSRESSENCKSSIHRTGTKLDVKWHKATVPSQVADWMYTYPLQGQRRTDGETGMELVGYSGRNILPRVACAMSHLNLWKSCFRVDESICILEHDAIFTREMPIEYIEDNIEDGDVLMLNDPIGATRKGVKYHENIVKHDVGIHTIDGVNSKSEFVPDGLAGNSAYVITPKAAKKAYELQNRLGLWPNDAILCKQLFPGQLKSIYPYVTKVVQKRSTTTV